MTTYATASTPRTATAPRSTAYWKFTAPVLLAVALLGFLLDAMGRGDLLGGFLTFDLAHNVVHLALAGAAFHLGYAAAGDLAMSAAKVVGIVYVALAIVGFLSPGVFGIDGILGLHLELGENLIHATLGGLALYAGFAD